MEEKLTSTELNKILCLSEVRAIDDAYNKAIFILLNKPFEKKFTKSSICECLKLDKTHFKKRLFNHFLGYTSIHHSPKYYLNENQEQELKKTIVENEEKFNCLSIMDIKLKVGKNN